MDDYKPPYLTGNTRLRAKTRLFGKPLIVLQVEMKRDAGTRKVSGDGYWPDDEYRFPSSTWWRDATVEDLTFMEGKVNRGGS